MFRDRRTCVHKVETLVDGNQGELPEPLLVFSHSDRLLSVSSKDGGSDARFSQANDVLVCREGLYSLHREHFMSLPSACHHKGLVAAKLGKAGRRCIEWQPDTWQPTAMRRRRSLPAKRTHGESNGLTIDVLSAEYRIAWCSMTSFRLIGRTSKGRKD